MPSEWDRFHRLIRDTITHLREADGDREGIELSIRRYLKRGDALGMSPLVLWDYFAISSPGIPERAGYCGYEAEQMVAIFNSLSKEMFGGK